MRRDIVCTFGVLDALRGVEYACYTLDVFPVFVKMYIYTKFFKKDPLFRVVFNVSRWFHAFFYSFRKFTFFEG